MPDFEPTKPSERPGGHKKKGHPPAPITGKVIVEPRCHICTHPERATIDHLIAIGGMSFSEIERRYEVDRRSVSNHKEKHLGIGDAALRQVVEAEARKVQENVEDGISHIIKRRVLLEVGIQSALEGIIQGTIAVEAKDAVAMIQVLNAMDAGHEAAGLEELQVQFEAVMRAIREIVPSDMWERIRTRAYEIAKGSDQPLIEAPAV